MEILVSQGDSQGASQGGSSSARSFDLVDLARPGVAPPLVSKQISANSRTSLIEQCDSGVRCYMCLQAQRRRAKITGFLVEFSSCSNALWVTACVHANSGHVQQKQ